MAPEVNATLDFTDVIVEPLPPQNIHVVEEFWETHGRLPLPDTEGEEFPSAYVESALGRRHVSTASRMAGLQPGPVPCWMRIFAISCEYFRKNKKKDCQSTWCRRLREHTPNHGRLELVDGNRLFPVLGSVPSNWLTTAL